MAVSQCRAKMTRGARLVTQNAASEGRDASIWEGWPSPGGLLNGWMRDGAVVDVSHSRVCFRASDPCVKLANDHGSARISRLVPSSDEDNHRTLGQ